MLDYTYVHEIDFDKHKTFICQYYKDGLLSHHLIRPTTATYEEITNLPKFHSYTIEGAVLSFTHDTSLAEILLESALFGITIDFVEIYCENDKTGWNDYKLIQTIDTHKEDVRKYLDKVEAKRYYVTINKNKNDSLKFLVIDRFAQESNVNFLKGHYRKNGIIAGFKEQMKAKEFCEKMNKENA